MTAVLPDFQEIMLADIAPPCECQWDDPLRPCDNSAEWLGLLRCCGSPRLVCDEHMQAYSWFIGQGQGYCCLSCGHLLTGKVWASTEKLG